MPPLPGQEEPLAKVLKAVNSLLARPDATPFAEPVAWRELELWDYPKIVRKMMDLGTIKRHLERGQYQTTAQAAADVRRVWNNCMLYNAEGSDFWLLAKSFSKRFEDRYRRIRNEYDVGPEPEETDEEEEGEESEDDDEEGEETEEEAEFEDETYEASTMTAAPKKREQPSRTTTPTLMDASAKLASQLLLLHGPELGHVVSMLERNCPKALEPLPLKLPGHMEIIVDAMDPDTFAALSAYVSEQCKGRGSVQEDSSQRPTKRNKRNSK